MKKNLQLLCMKFVRLDTMNDLTFEMQIISIFRLITALFLGVVVGYERKNRHKEAGVRTHAIVAIGSCLMMLISKYGFMGAGDFDESRIAAQIISSVGFLGAGIIMIKDDAISGLTTAAGIWVISGIGMAIGAGLYVIGVGTTILMLLIQMITHISYT